MIMKNAHAGQIILRNIHIANGIHLLFRPFRIRMLLRMHFSDYKK